jgi:hypothetical protein
MAHLPSSIAANESKTEDGSKRGSFARRWFKRKREILFKPKSVKPSTSQSDSITGTVFSPSGIHDPAPANGAEGAELTSSGMYIRAILLLSATQPLSRR